MAAWSAEQIPGQDGKVAVVTGANSGLGLITARELARHGAQVVLAVRDTDAGQRAVTTIRKAVPEAKVQVRKLDLASLSSVGACAKTLTKQFPAIDLLINNAGVVRLGPPLTTADGFELHIGTNMLGHFALTGLLLDALSRADAPRVVSLSSVTHKDVHLDFEDLMSHQDYDASRAYRRSKLATTVFGLELDRRLRAADSPVASVIAHPGLSNTNLTPRAWEGRGKLGHLVAQGFLLITQSPEKGALPQLFAATNPSVRSGQFFGPSGFREARGNVAEVKPSAEAVDASVGERLWSAAQSLTKTFYL
ncbi:MULTISPECIES: oxidoreductase [Streptomyces]|uniref:Oxidoreductase n=1 Tax=Streptomyces pratisoli TaxID=3139917 RepID=A0ACC6QV64_9ACTN|nr:oxidoreductase [Streptomyces sp. NBC_00259]